MSSQPTSKPHAQRLLEEKQGRAAVEIPAVERSITLRVGISDGTVAGIADAKIHAGELNLPADHLATLYFRALWDAALADLAARQEAKKKEAIEANDGTSQPAHS